MHTFSFQSVIRPHFMDEPVRFITPSPYVLRVSESIAGEGCGTHCPVRTSNTNVLILLKWYGNQLQPDVSLTHVLQTKAEMPHQ